MNGEYQEEPKNQHTIDMDMLENHVACLAEHFDTVQIFVTKQRTKTTFSVQSGSGNWYARTAQVREWLIRDDEYIRNDARKE